MWSISCSTNLDAIELHCPSLVILDRAMPRLSPSAVSSTPICAQTAGTVFSYMQKGCLFMGCTLSATLDALSCSCAETQHKIEFNSKTWRMKLDVMQCQREAGLQGGKGHLDTLATATF